MSESVNCPNCNSLQESGAMFCSRCGTNLSTKTEQPVPTADQNHSAANPSQGKAVASLVLGILAVICIFLGYGALLGIVLAIVGIVLGTSAKKEAPSSMATAGVVLSIIALALCVISFLACVACVGLLFSVESLYY